MKLCVTTTLRLLLCSTLLAPLQALALDLQPRTWTHLPIDVNFAGVGYVYTEADIFTDPAIQLENVEMKLHTWAAKYIRTFELFGRSARIELAQGYQEGEWTGLLRGVPASAKRSGMNDGLIRFATMLYGAPPLAGADYRAYRTQQQSETLVGVGLVLRVPTGAYEEDQLINLGRNRFALRPQLGLIHNRGNWTAELTAEAAFFTDNNDFFNGQTLEKAPLYIVHGHLIYSFRPGLWLGLSAGYDRGGEHTIDGVDKGDRQQNSAWAISGGYPLSRVLGLKLAYINTRTHESTGLDSESLLLSMAYFWQ